MRVNISTYGTGTAVSCSLSYSVRDPIGLPYPLCRLLSGCFLAKKNAFNKSVPIQISWSFIVKTILISIEIAAILLVKYTLNIKSLIQNEVENKRSFKILFSVDTLSAQLDKETPLPPSAKGQSPGTTPAIEEGGNGGLYDEGKYSKLRFSVWICVGVQDQSVITNRDRWHMSVAKSMKPSSSLALLISRKCSPVPLSTPVKENACGRSM